jgi:hypothetical protein
MAILPKAIYMLNVIPINIPIAFITEIEKSTLKFIWKHKRPCNSQGNTQPKEQCCRYHDTYFKQYYKSVAKKKAWSWHKNRHEDQWNRIEDPDMNPHRYAHLILTKTKNIQWRKDSLFHKCC